MPSHTEYPVRIAVEGHGYRGVSEKVLDEFRVDAALQEQGSAGVPQVVPSDPVRTLALHLSDVKGKGQVNNSVQRGCGLLRGKEYVVVEVRFLDGQDRLFWPRDLAEVSSPGGIC
jgi:hypothetical protein